MSPHGVVENHSEIQVCSCGKPNEKPSVYSPEMGGIISPKLVG